ncbi:hydroxysteroid dehydrogenase-like protein 2 [Corythoichthys intestinalis]|uniref:hydroxysteroid dehydrogenase-like protein 2 n=1 Tax=Corythoichthys intestinalis TaxID=161448 RepID=UPI0025A5174A|nr:hydroxysteroid dehydrogenase-like protein 2 [Corythoichthys intestinalis]XP_061800821.1 hydroxysteroid dehydrogenase-like protein 2 isoform X1 [Nerophis lumbriciformis]
MLPNSGKLAGRTLFVTGASRGIGKAIALKAARDGANVVIAAKTAQPHPKLPGTIFSAAKEVEDLGGKALPCVVDIRDEKQVEDAVRKAVDAFGGIDILVNNASAINLTGTLETPMKKVDLMLGINLRGTYMTSKLVIPHLLKSSSPHILNLSPPLNLNPIWFKNHTAYTMAKYGMSMCVLGMAEEFRGQIAVNALWPRTAIQTAAMDMLGGEGIGKQCRTADIMADAAYAVLTRPKTFTGNFLVDEDVLREEGVRDMEPYAVQPGHPLLPDFFLDEDPEALARQMEQHGATPAFKPSASSAPPSPGSPVESTFEVIRGLLSEDLVKSTQALYRFDLSGEHTGVWFLDLKSGSGGVGRGEPRDPPDVVMTMDSEVFGKMFAGKLKPTLAFMSGKLRIKGDMTAAIKLEKMMARVSKL